jgi:membrane protease YdiL (CAAX protease family)
MPPAQGPNANSGRNGGKPLDRFLKYIFTTAGGMRSGWRLLIWFAIVIALQVAIGLVLRGMHQLGDHGFLDPVGMLKSDLLLTLVPVMCATWIMASIERRSLRDYYLPGSDLLGRNFLVGTLWGLGAVSLLVGLIAAGGGYRITGLALREHVVYYIFIWLAAALAIGIVEEAAFRGYLLRTLGDGIGFVAAALLLSLGFGALHYFSKPYERWEDFASTGLLGLFICLTVLRTGNLSWGMGFHFAFDWAAIFFFSGRNAGEYAPGRLFETAWPASDRITGGMLGPEASWFVFPVIALLFLGFHFVYRRRATPAPGR